MMGRTYKRIIVAGVAAIVLFLAFFVVRGFIYTKVASIVDDEAAWDLRDASPSMKVIILQDGTVARYVDETDSVYVGEIQDEFEIPKKDADVRMWYACDGCGVVFLRDYGVQPVYGEADDTADVIGSMCYVEGDVPSTYKCMGYKDGWFSVEVDGNTGYVMEDKVIWDAVDSF